MVYLIPSLLSENAVETIPPYVIESVKKCNVIFAENIRTARRFLKKMDATIVIDNFQWFEIHKHEEQLLSDFRKCIRDHKDIAIISEAGCPGVADPGQILVAAAQEMNVTIRPLVGPGSILLALMASGLNGQQFSFHGYLPVAPDKRIKKIRQLEEESLKRNCTQIFIETPYRNHVLYRNILKTCKDRTMLCVAVDITSPDEWIRTNKIGEWKKKEIPFQKKPAIFLLLGS